MVVRYTRMLETKLEECFEVSSKDDGLEHMHTIQLVRSLLIDLPCAHVFLETRCLLNKVWTHGSEGNWQ